MGSCTSCECCDDTPVKPIAPTASKPAEPIKVTEPEARKLLSKLDKHEVSGLLRLWHRDQYVDQLRNIIGSDLMVITDGDLKELGVTLALHRQGILASIEGVKAQGGVFVSQLK